MGPGMTNVINLYTYYLNKTLEEWHAIQYGHLKNGIRHPTKTWWHDATSSWNLPKKFTDVQQYYLWKSWNCRGGRKAIQQLKSQKAQRDIHCEKVAQTAKCVLHFDIKTYVFTLGCNMMLEQLDLILNEIAQVLEAM